MDDYRVDPDIFHQNDIKGKITLERLVDHGMAAILDHHGFLSKFADIRQRFHQNLGLGYFLSYHGHLTFSATVVALLKYKGAIVPLLPHRVNCCVSPGEKGWIPDAQAPLHFAENQVRSAILAKSKPEN
jgi:hypothetical protein